MSSCCPLSLFVIILLSFEILVLWFLFGSSATICALQFNCLIFCSIVCQLFCAMIGCLQLACMIHIWNMIFSKKFYQVYLILNAHIYPAEIGMIMQFKIAKLSLGTQQ